MLILVILICVIAISIWYSKRSADSSEALDDQITIEEAGVNNAENRPVAFGYKMTWFAVRSANKEKLIEIFGLKNVKEASWQTGIESAYNKGVFISPEIEGWTLIVGTGLPSADSDDGLDKATVLLKTLSHEFGEAQHFSTHRVVEYHCWIKAINGSIKRLYAYLGESGETLAISGKPTSIEENYNLINTLSEEAQREEYFAREDLTYPDEELVMLIAANWSIDPTKLDEKTEPKEPGLIGKRY